MRQISKNKHNSDSDSIAYIYSIKAEGIKHWLLD